MDFGNPKVYGDTSMSDGLVVVNVVAVLCPHLPPEVDVLEPFFSHRPPLPKVGNRGQITM